jgi:tRNA(Arg) A34 adenosine deaminase TadA
MLARAVELAGRARAGGDHPFGALLVDPAGRIVLEAGNSVETESDATGHAETNLVRLASKALTVEQRATMTLYTSTEPCAMCAGAIYWSQIGAVVYALPEAELFETTGAHPANPTMNLPCREVFAHGQGGGPSVRGPIETPGMRDVHAGYWD